MFGTLDSTDAQKYSEQIEVLRKNQQHFQILAEDQASIFRSQVEIFGNLSGELKNWTRDFDSSFNNLTQFVNNVIMEAHAASVLAKVNKLFTIFLNKLDNYLLTQDKLLEIILSAMHGKVHPYVLSMNELYDQTSKVIPYVQSKTKILISNNKSEIIDVYENMQISIYIKNNKLHFIISMPLITDNEFYIYKMTFIPQFVHRNAYAYIIPRASYIDMDRELQHYALLEENYLNECSRFSGKYICESKHPLFLLSNENKDCESKLFVSSETIPENCNVKISTINHLMFTKLAASNSWMFLAPTSTKVSIVCRQNRETMELNGVGMIKLEDECRLITPSLILESISTVTSEIEVEFASNVQFNKDFYLLNDDNKPSLIPSHMKNIDNSGHLELLNNLSDKVENYERDSKKSIPEFVRENQAVIYSDMPSGVSIIISIIIIITIFKIKRDIVASRQQHIDVVIQPELQQLNLETQNLV